MTAILFEKRPCDNFGAAFASPHGVQPLFDQSSTVRNELWHEINPSIGTGFFISTEYAPLSPLYTTSSFRKLRFLSTLAGAETLNSSRAAINGGSERSINWGSAEGATFMSHFKARLRLPESSSSSKSNNYLSRAINQWRVANQRWSTDLPLPFAAIEKAMF